MAIRLSTGLRNFMLSRGSLSQAFNGGFLEVRTGAQPAEADDAPIGTKLVTFTAASGVWTAETPATGSIELTGGAAGSINTVTVDSINILDTAVPFNASLAQTASDLADALNRSSLNTDFDAEASSATVTLTSRPCRAVRYNGITIAGSLTTITATYTAPSGGVAATNGLWFESAASGILLKRTTQVATGVAIASGTAGWFRLKGVITDNDADSTTLIRMDGSIATSGGNLTMSPTTMTIGATQTLPTFSPTIPAEY
jgi:hypothetical protein